MMEDMKTLSPETERDRPDPVKCGARDALRPQVALPPVKSPKAPAVTHEDWSVETPFFTRPTTVVQRRATRRTKLKLPLARLTRIFV